jgi:type IV secretion system protein VirB2
MSILKNYCNKEFIMKKAYAGLGFFLAANSLFASGGEKMPWDDGLTTIQKALSGNTVMIIGIIMIIGGGLALAFTEGQAIKKLFWIIIGIGIAINAARLFSVLFGSGAGILL